MSTASETASDLSDDDNSLSGASDEEVCYFVEISPSGLSYGGEVSLPDTEMAPFVAPYTSEVSSSKPTQHISKAFQVQWMTGNVPAPFSFTQLPGLAQDEGHEFCL